MEAGVARSLPHKLLLIIEAQASDLLACLHCYTPLILSKRIYCAYCFSEAVHAIDQPRGSLPRQLHFPAPGAKPPLSSGQFKCLLRPAVAGPTTFTHPSALLPPSKQPLSHSPPS